MITTDPAKAARRKRPSLLSSDDPEQIEPPGSDFIGFVEPPPPYQAGPPRKLPSWAEHLRDLRPLKLEE